jgi:hypothetical protein
VVVVCVVVVVSVVSVVSVSKTNVAVTDSSAFIVTWHLSAPEQAPDQPLKVELESSSSPTPRVTTVPEEKANEQVEPQTIPAGLELIVPLPSPALLTVRVWVVAMADVAPLTAIARAVEPPAKRVNAVNEATAKVRDDRMVTSLLSGISGHRTACQQGFQEAVVARSQWSARAQDGGAACYDSLSLE